MDVYSEVTIHKQMVKNPEKTKTNLRNCAWSLTIIGILLSLYLLIPAAVLWIIYFFAKRFLDVDYEYIHFNDDLDIDFVMGGISRKNLMSIHLSQVILIAPIDDPQLEEYSHLETVDYSARSPEYKPYVMVCVHKDVKKKVYLQLTEKMLATLKLRIPAKLTIANET